jgi:hypothetical protein
LGGAAAPASASSNKALAAIGKPMGWTATLAGGGFALGVLLVSGWMQARRGIGRLSLVPWDYLMILSAILLVAALARIAILWRDGWPL